MERDKKKVNSKVDDGAYKICLSCGSFRHLLAECPDSYENLSKSKDYAAAVAAEETSEEEAYFTNDLTGNLRNMKKEREVEDIILYTNNKKKIDGLGSETLGMCLLDCGCTMNVMGEIWWESYKESLSETDKKKVKEYEARGKKFRFGGGEVLPSLKQVKFPAVLVNKKVFMKSHVVRSRIPIL